MTLSDQTSNVSSPLAALEPRLRTLLPADLYAQAWLSPSSETLQKVFEHLRTLQHILYDYVPRQLAESPPTPGVIRSDWQAGSLMFTDLTGFTPLLEANALHGAEGAQVLLDILTQYFSQVLEVASKSGGSLLEFTGDAMLFQFAHDERRNDVALAVRAGLRMQRAMAAFADIQTARGNFSLGMRVGIHTGRIFSADIGTPMRMEHVVLGRAVQITKYAEGAGVRGRVNVTVKASERVYDLFRFEEGQPGYFLPVDDLEDSELGEFDIGTSRRLASSILLDRSVEALLEEITRSVAMVESLACLLPGPVLHLLVENAAQREIPPDFPTPTVVFVNFIGLPEAIDASDDESVAGLLVVFSEAFARINAAVEARGGVLKKVTYHMVGSDIMIFFGAPVAHTDDTLRAVTAALAIREIIAGLPAPLINGQPVQISCQIGIAQGPAFAAEIGEPRGRREYNVLGDTINTAARLMGQAQGNRILISESVYALIGDRFDVESLGALPLKGKSALLPVYALRET
jgi:class 3 adenylate cyclase